MRFRFNDPTRKSVRRALRRISPEPESKLWQHLRARRLSGLKFRRQYSIGPYVVDFYCPATRLVIEVDGDSHARDEAKLYDRDRSEYFADHNIRVIRFLNAEVMEDIEKVLEKIQVACV